MGIEMTGRAIVDRWRMILWWSVATVVLVAVVALWWNGVKDSQSLHESISNYPSPIKALFGGKELFGIATAPGFLHVVFFSLAAPLLLTGLAVGIAVQQLAGEEEDGLLDLLVSYPVSRRQIVVEKSLALVVIFVIVGAVAWGGLLAADALVDLDVTLTGLLAAVVGVVLLALFNGMVALAVGALTGSRMFALAGAVIALGAGYVLLVVSQVLDDADWAKYLSPYYYGTANQPLTGTWPVGGHIALVVLGAAAVAAAVYAFDRRDRDLRA